MKSRLWTALFGIWCLYWHWCEIANNGTHPERSYWFFGWFRSALLNIGADVHHHWKDRQYYKKRCLLRAKTRSHNPTWYQRLIFQFK